MSKILIADDSGTARMFIQRCLEISGCRQSSFLEAENGQEALDKIRGEKPDLVLTDLNMPVMTGKELLESMAQEAELAAIPVMVITSAGNPAREEELRNLGAKAVLSKPISPPVLTEILQPLLKQWGESDDDLCAF